MRVIVLEGVNGAGKSSAGTFIQQALQAAGQPCLLADPAGFGLLGQLLRRHIVHPSFEPHPDLDAVLFTSLRIDGARQILQIFQFQPSATIILERWSLALLAYGAADGARLPLISELRAVLRNVLSVDLTILLNVSGDRAFKRLRGSGESNRFESRGPNYLDDVARLYRYYAANEDRTEIIDAAGDQSTINHRIAKILER